MISKTRICLYDTFDTYLCLFGRISVCLEKSPLPNRRRLRNIIGTRVFLGGILRLTMLDARISARFVMGVLTFLFCLLMYNAKSAGVTHTRTLTKNIQESSLYMRY